MTGYVYMMTNQHHTTIYTGVTNDIARRVGEHKQGTGSKFTGKYKLIKLVWMLEYFDITDAIAEEKRIKGGSRAKKLALIESQNPDWRDLTESLI